MLTFRELYEQSTKTYDFKIGIAGDLPEDFLSNLETALKRFDVINVKKTKTTPVQERPLDFPQLQNTQVNFFEITIRYPTTPQILREFIAQICKINTSYIIVRYPDEPIERYQEDTETKPYKTLLDTPLEGESAQNDVGQTRIMELIRELEQSRKERAHDPAAGAPKGTQEKMPEPAASSSPIGSKK